jgi:UDP-N-acetyl-D-mannosaminuronate dehydrogenase
LASQASFEKYGEEPGELFLATKSISMVSANPPALTIIEALQKSGASVAINDPYFPKIGRGRRYDIQMQCVPLEGIGQYNCVVILTDHSDYDHRSIVGQA